MKKLIDFVGARKGAFSAIAASVSLIGLLLGGWYLLAPFGVIVLLIILVIKGIYPAVTLSNTRYRTIPKSLLDEVLPIAEAEMIADGYGPPPAYVENEHDCSDYVAAWQAKIHKHLWLRRSRFPYNGAADPLIPFRFVRSDNGRRHQVLKVSTDRGAVYIDTYRINGSLYRKLDLKEELNGTMLR